MAKCGRERPPLTQRRVLCKEACSAEESALQRRVLCKGECSAMKRALQRSVLCKGECSANHLPGIEASTLARHLPDTEALPRHGRTTCLA